MSKLFEASEINGMKLSNRIVRSATWEGMAADDGACTPKLIGLMTELAKGGVGLIVSSHAYVSPEGQAGPWQLGIEPGRVRFHVWLVPNCRPPGKQSRVPGGGNNRQNACHRCGPCAGHLYAV